MIRFSKITFHSDLNGKDFLNKHIKSIIKNPQHRAGLQTALLKEVKFHIKESIIKVLLTNKN